MHSSSITFATGWKPFSLRLHKPDSIRSLQTPDGVGDRLRVVAFAELQARDAFLYGCERFPNAPADWRADWQRFAEVEDRHAQMLLTRMSELGISIETRAVSDKLTQLCRRADNAVDFLFLLSTAEERGMEAGEVLGKQMAPIDAASAAIFAQIAEEEVEHVASAKAALANFNLEELQVRARAISAQIK